MVKSPTGVRARMEKARKLHQGENWFVPFEVLISKQPDPHEFIRKHPVAVELSRKMGRLGISKDFVHGTKQYALAGAQKAEPKISRAALQGIRALYTDFYSYYNPDFKIDDFAKKFRPLWKKLFEEHELLGEPLIPRGSLFHAAEKEMTLRAVDNAHQYRECLQKSIDNAPAGARATPKTIRRNRLLKRTIADLLTAYKQLGVSSFMREVGLELKPEEVDRTNAYEALQWMHHYYANPLWHFVQLHSPAPLQEELFGLRDSAKTLLDRIGGTEGSRLSVTLRRRSPQDSFVGESVRDSSQPTGSSFKLFLHDPYDPTKRLLYISKGKKTVGAVRVVARQTKSREPALETYFISVNPAFAMTKADAANILNVLRDSARGWGFKELLLPAYISDHHSVQDYLDGMEKGRPEKLPFKPIGGWEALAKTLGLKSPLHPAKRIGEPVLYYRLKL